MKTFQWLIVVWQMIGTCMFCYMHKKPRAGNYNALWATAFTIIELLVLYCAGAFSEILK